MKLKLYRDRVISIARGQDLVGVYVKLPKQGVELLLAEMSPEKADEIIKLWNGVK